MEILANWFVSVLGLDGVGLTAIRVEVGTIFERSRRFRTEDLAMIEPGLDFRSVGGRSVVLVAPDRSDISLRYRCE